MTDFDDLGGFEEDEACQECGYSHALEPNLAQSWHTNNPCSHCVYDIDVGHADHCPNNAALAGMDEDDLLPEEDDG